MSGGRRLRQEKNWRTVTCPAFATAMTAMSCSIVSLQQLPSMRMVESMTSLSLVLDLLEVRRLLKNQKLGN